MKKEMFEFIIHVIGYDSPMGIEYNPMTSYRHFGAPKNVPTMDRPFARGYKTYPHLSRPAYAGAAASGVTTVVGGAVATVYPFVLATATYPEVSGPQYQSAMTGNVGIGGGGHDLIYGNHERGSPSALWNYFAQNF